MTGCAVNIRNSLLSEESFPQHGLVKSLEDAIALSKSGVGKGGGQSIASVCARLRLLQEVLQVLLRHGADMSARNSRSRTAFDEFLVLKHELSHPDVARNAITFESLLKPSYEHSLPPPSSSRASSAAVGMHQSWFGKIFGFEETSGGPMGTFAFVRSQLRITQKPLGAHVLTTPHGKELWVGRFTQESLGQLFSKLQVSISRPSPCHRPACSLKHCCSPYSGCLGPAQHLRRSFRRRFSVPS
jgi:hypothetical protein